MLAPPMSPALSLCRPICDGLCGKRVVLVDDVMTTGATLNAAAGALLSAGVAQVDTLVFARVVPGRGD